MANISSPKVSITSIGQLQAVSNVRLTQRLFEHDTLELSIPLVSLEKDAVLLKKPDRFLNEPLEWKVGDSFAWKGLVVGALSSLDAGSGAQARITALAPTFLLENGTGYKSFEEKTTLDTVIKRVLQPYTSSNVFERVGKCEKHDIPFPVQYGESDFEFLLRYCNQYGEWFYWTGEKLHIGKHEGKAIDLLAKRDLKNVESTIRVQPLGFDLSARDYLKDEALACNSKKLSHAKLTGFEYVALRASEGMMYSRPTKIPRFRLNEKDDKQLEQLAAVRKLSLTKGLVVLSGVSQDSRLSVGKGIVVKYSKERESKQSETYGEYIIIRAVHEMSSKGAYQNYVEAIPAEAHIPPLNPNRRKVRASLDTAIVTDNNDPEKLGRVKLRFLWQKKDQATPWVRVSMAQAGADRGSFFVPEKNDEVLVGFEAGNPERPVVLGSLYHGKAKAEYWKNDDNLKKGLRTKSGNEILFFDEKGKERIEIKSKDSAFMMSLSLEEGGKVKIKANKIEIEGSNGVSIKGAKVEINADADVSIKGSVVKLN